MLPIIADDMKSADTRAKVQKELATSIRQQIDQQVDALAIATSNRIADIWRSFQRAHAKTLEIAEGDATFRTYIDTLDKSQLKRLDEVVSLLLAKDGSSGVGAALRDGRLARAVTSLSDEAMAIARDRQSIDDALKWSALSGDRLKDVIALGLHQRAQPSDFAWPMLVRLLELDNRAAQLKLAGVSRNDRAILFELENQRLKKLGRGLSQSELATLAGYLRGLDRGASQTVLTAVADQPAKMRRLAADHVRQAVTDSRDQARAVNMLLRDGSALAPQAIIDDLGAAGRGDIHPLLIWERHPIVVFAAGFAALLMLLILRSLWFGGARRKRRAARAQVQKQSEA
ncbi:MAG: hypothetical protein AAFY64_06825 [Pseudomonadota bacterium]